MHGVDDAVFPVDLMCRLGQQLAGWLLPHDELFAIAGFEEVCRVGLAVPELLDAQRGFDLRDMLVDVGGEVGDVDRLSYGTCHLVAAAMALTSRRGSNMVVVCIEY